MVFAIFSRTLTHAALIGAVTVRECPWAAAPCQSG